jgi:hypothetical protein
MSLVNNPYRVTSGGGGLGLTSGNANYCIEVDEFKFFKII